MDIIRENHKSDTEIWISFKKGDMDAFSLIYELNFHKLFEYGTRFIKDEEIVKDSIQDLFVKLWTNRDNLGEAISMRNYLFTALRNNILNKLSGSKKLIYTDELEDNYDFEMTFPAESRLILGEMEKVRGEKIINGLNNLTPRQKEAIYLRFYESLTYDEVADVMKITVKATYKIVARALESLKEHIKDIHIFLSLLFSSRKRTATSLNI